MTEEKQTQEKKELAAIRKAMMALIMRAMQMLNKIDNKIDKNE